MDRGFLFGDGVYEVIPAYAGKMVGFRFHINRLTNGLASLNIRLSWDHSKWRSTCEQMLELNDGENFSLYIHVSRGADTTRSHNIPDDLQPTVFLMASQITGIPEQSAIEPFLLISAQDLRWQHCDIKSTALLGNVLHFQQSVKANCDETLLFNERFEITEASSSNVFVVKDGVVITPRLDNHLLPGITRQIILEILRKDKSIKFEEKAISLDDARHADEIWITSSTRGIKPVTALDNRRIGDGEIGPVWQQVSQLYFKHMFDFD